MDVPAERIDRTGRFLQKEILYKELKRIGEKPLEICVADDTGQNRVVAILTGENLQINWDEEMKCWHISSDAELMTTGKEILAQEMEISMEIEE